MNNPTPSTRRPLRQQSPRRGYVRKSFALDPEDEAFLGSYKSRRDISRPVERPQIDEKFTSVQKFDLLVDDRTVDRIMGPDPLPMIDVEYQEIQNELQKKLVEEI